MPRLIKLPYGLINLVDHVEGLPTYQMWLNETQVLIEKDEFHLATFKDIKTALKQFLDIDISENTPHEYVEQMARDWLCMEKCGYFARCSTAKPYFVVKLKTNVKSLKFTYW